MILLDQLLSRYGDPHAPGFEAQWIAKFELPYPMMFGAGSDAAILTHARCHKLAVDAFVGAFRAIKAEGLADDASEFNGIVSMRSIRGHPGHLSAHAWGLAVDINASRNPLGGPVRQHVEVIRAFVEHGFFWGGAYKSRVDGMHFSLTGF